MKNAALTEKEFNKIYILTNHRISRENIEIAKEVLVNNKSQAEVAEENGITRQRVSYVVNRVNAALNDAPTGSVNLNLWVSPKLSKKILKLIEDEEKK